MNEDKLYSFIMRGELTKVSLEDSGVVSKHSSSAALTQKYIDSLSLDLLDDECVESAKVMATVYTAIAAFENMVRQFVVKILMENKGENWWTECVSDKIRKSADSRKAEEDKIKWHTHRGTSMIEASNPVPTPLLGHRCRSSQEITGSPTPFSTSNHYLWICASASFSLSNPNIAA